MLQMELKNFRLANLPALFGRQLQWIIAHQKETSPTVLLNSLSAQPSPPTATPEAAKHCLTRSRLLKWRAIPKPQLIQAMFCSRSTTCRTC
jgi:hypothetical protein